MRPEAVAQTTPPASFYLLAIVSRQGNWFPEEESLLTWTRTNVPRKETRFLSEIVSFL